MLSFVLKCPEWTHIFVKNKCDELLTQFNVKENLDKLHAVVTEARARKQVGYTGQDLWREDLQPRATVRARTIPLLQQECDRLQAELEVVSSHPILCCTSSA